MTKVDHEHEQLISMVNQLLDEREVLKRENEYLKAKLNESVLIETIKEMKQERDLLFKLLSNLTNKSVDSDNLSSLSRSNTSSIMNQARVHRLKPTIDQQQKQQAAGFYPMNTYASPVKPPSSNRKIFVYKPQTEEFPKPIRKPDLFLKHSQNSPFQHYRSQSLQNLT